MTRKEALKEKLIRNVDTVEKYPEARAGTSYESMANYLTTGTAATKLGASIDVVPPGKKACPYHCHFAQEEMFVVLAGNGTLRVAGELLPIVTGDVIFIPCGREYPHQIINTSDAPLKYMSISTKESPEYIEYPDSHKFQSIAKDGDGEFVVRIQHFGENVDYWANEPA